MTKHTMTDLIEVIGINTTAFITAVFTDIESVLKIALLLVSIGYTCYKWIKDVKAK